MTQDTKDTTSQSTISEEDRTYNIKTEVTIDNVRTLLGSNADFVCRMLLVRDNPDIPAALVYIDGMVDGKVINDNILKPLAQERQFDGCKTESEAIRLISMGKVYSSSLKLKTNMKELVDDLLEGNAAIIFNDERTAFTFEAKAPLSRAITEPSGENVLKGAKDSFVENLRINTALCRKKLTSPYLTIEQIIVGKQTRTNIAIVYMKNIANSALIDEVKKRLEGIEIDRVITAGSVESFITDNNYSTFPQVLFTERPDKFCVNLIDGRVGILIEGLPTSYIVPGTLLQFIQAPDDYSFQFIIASTVRFIRFLSLFITLVLPGFYIAITTFHPEMLPAELTFSIVASREGVPFPMFLEVIILLLAFELLIEAGIRLPKVIGQTVSIVGGLVVGQAAVEAKLVSPATVMVIAITSIAGFLMPNQDFSNAVRLWRLILAILSSIIGMFGLSFGLIFLLFHWCRMETFGVPYLDPFVANEEVQLQDTIFRFPLRTMKKRPNSLNQINKNRME